MFIKKPFLFLLASLLMVFGSWSQAEETWKKVYSIPIDSGAVWSVDLSQQLYLYQKQNISRWTAQGKKSLEQSIKQMGELSTIDANNQLKIAIFSEQQQQICFLDNGLARTNDFIDLEQFGIEWANLFCTSNQTDRFWIYDQINNELSLLSTAEEQQQKIQNLRQIADLGILELMTEKNNNLYIIDEKNVLAHFDIFGTLVNSFELGDYQLIFFTDTGIFGVKDKKLFQLFTFEHNVFDPVPSLEIPAEITDEIVQIKSSGDKVFFATNKELFVYQIIR